MNKDKVIEMFERLSPMAQMRVVAETILETNNRTMANMIMERKLNDIEYQAFKRFLRGLL